MKASNLSADNFKKVLELDGSTTEPAIQSGDTGQRTPCFDSCQMITTLMCNQFSPGFPKESILLSRVEGRGFHVEGEGTMSRVTFFLNFFFFLEKVIIDAINVIKTNKKNSKKKKTNGA